MQNDNNIIHPNLIEKLPLQLAYNRFFNIFDEFMSEKFWNLSPEIRLFKIKNCFEIYTELLKYEPIICYLNYLETHRPKEESFIAEEYFAFIRNILNHFPYFNSWNDIYITEKLSTWNNPKNSSIIKFLKNNYDKKTVKYRIWNKKQKKMIYMDINFPKSTNTKIFIKDLISERNGMLFCMVLMKKVLNSQLVN